MKKKPKPRRDTVVATRLTFEERRIIEGFCVDEDRNLCNMIRALIREAITARQSKDDAEFHAARIQPE